MLFTPVEEPPGPDPVKAWQDCALAVALDTDVEAGALRLYLVMLGQPAQHVTELATSLRLTFGHVRHYLSALRRHGLVQRTYDPDNGRALYRALWLEVDA